jgi:hypothetical protein
MGMQLMVFFLQRRIQPLQSWASKLWSYSGLTDPSRVSAQDPEKKDLDKRVRSLTTLTAQMEILACTTIFLTPLTPYQRYASYNLKVLTSLLFPHIACLFICVFFFELSLQNHQFFVSRPHLPEEGPIDVDPVLADSGAPRLSKIRMEMKQKFL